MRTIACPECDEAIEIEAGMEGRRLACPECGEKLTVPERKKAGGKMRRKPAAGPNWGLIGGALAGIVALAVVGVVVYKATRPKPAAQGETAGKPGELPAPTGGGDAPLKLNLPLPSGKGDTPANPPAPPPPQVPQGWAKYTMPDANLDAHFPGKPDEVEESTSDMSVRVENRKWGVELPGGAGGYSLDAMITPAGTTLNREQVDVFYRYPRHAREKQAKARFVAERAATFGGFKATELEYALPTGEPVAVRYGFVRSGGRLMFVVAVAGGKGITPADRAAFFDSVRPAK
jgi:DNA-directed RNA polymerase subunit RPC12/RpoP